jgi:hypothetical protein
MARIQPGESPGARLVEPKASQRASASSRGGVRRKSGADPSHTSHRLIGIVQESKTALTGWMSLLRNSRGVEPSARDRQMGATAVTMLRMEAMGQRGLPRTQEARGQRTRGLEHKQERARAMAPEPNASTECGTACKAVSSDGVARIGTGQGSMRETKCQGTAGYVTRMSGGVGGEGREVRLSPIPIGRSRPFQ